MLLYATFLEFLKEENAPNLALAFSFTLLALLAVKAAGRLRQVFVGESPGRNARRRATFAGRRSRRPAR
ncbi:hypothetical protein [uncultured Hymenobacter sp.]|uniref:hypothetical protein n=1 Tax=uncultured Hymenobacter sp. TaxID=170016 RepID=UPI0035CBB10A